MKTRTIPQWNVGGNSLKRYGDFLTQALFDAKYSEFKFAVAYMRSSGLDRIMPGVEALLNRGGSVYAAVGIDDRITSADAIEDLISLATTVRVVHSDTGPIFHPKLFLFEGTDDALVIIGSANLTRDGLYRNIEYGVEHSFELADRDDLQTYDEFRREINSLLGTSSNVQILDGGLLADLEADGKVLRENAANDPGGKPRRLKQKAGLGRTSFPPLALPPPPPGVQRRAASMIVQAHRQLGPNNGTIFVMQLSAFDSSHRTGVKGTADILIPADAMPFFPPLVPRGKKYPDAAVRSILNHPEGPELHTYRLWFYPAKSENRLTMNRRTIDLTNIAGGDLVVFSKISTPDADYDVSIVPTTSPSYNLYNGLCTRTSNAKRWGCT